VARTKGLSGVAIGMIGTGVLLVYSAIKNSSPLTELRNILTGQRPEKLSTETRATQSLASPAYVPQPAGSGTSGKVTGTNGVKANVLSAMQYIASTWGLAVNGMGPGSVPNSDHPKGLALDAMTTNLSTGTAIANYFIMNATARRVKYIIWQRRIWFPDGRGWQPYSGPNPHTNHVHISFYPPGNVRAQ
jgi:hypothetical protein